MQAEPNSTENSECSSAPTIRNATVDDGAKIWRLVRDCDVLDTNSCYAYLLICRDFAPTSLVAVEGEDVVGFVTAYIPPARPDVVFVWQIGIAPTARKQGLGKKLLRHLLETPACNNVRYLEATVTPSNSASSRLFRSISEQRSTGFEVFPGFKSSDFGGTHEEVAQHEPEDLVRVGPFENEDV